MAAGLEGALKAQGLYSQSHLSPGVKLEGLLSLFAQDWAGVGRVSEPGTRMVGHPDIESTSKVTAGSDLRGPGGPPSPEQLFSEAGVTKRLFQPSCHLWGPRCFMSSKMTFMSSKKYRNCLCI